MTVRQKLEASLKAHERAAPQLVREALEELKALERDAARYTGARDALAAAIASPEADDHPLVDAMAAWRAPDGEDRGPNATELDAIVDQILAVNRV